MDRSTYLALGGSITFALTAGNTFEYVRTGKPNPDIRGFGMIAAFPIALWGASLVNHDPHDTAAWAVTSASTGLLAYALWPVVDHYVLGNYDDEGKPRQINLGPTIVAGPRGAGAGLGFAAMF